MIRFKEFLNNIENVNQLPISKEIANIGLNYEGEFWEAWENNYDFILKDGTEVKLKRYEYKCILHNSIECAGDNIYEINNGELFKCLDCGTWLVRRNDLIRKYDLENDLYSDFCSEVLFSKEWIENEIVSWIEKRVKAKKEYNARAEQRRLARKERERMQYSGVECCCCVHMINNECECGIYEYDEDECDFEARGH